MSVAKEQREKLIWEFPKLERKPRSRRKRHLHIARDIRSF